MLHIIDILSAAGRQRTVAERGAFAPDAGERDRGRFDDIDVESERSRSPAAMRRQTVRADLLRMMRTFGVKPDDVPLYQDELVEAEHICALCRHVGRCRAWSAKGCRGDAPRLFCANAALFEEITPDPFWSETAPGTWHAETRTSPLLRLLASDETTLTETPPKLGARKFERFISIASTIDALLDQWSPMLEAADQAAKPAKLSGDLEAVIDKLFDQQEGLRRTDFARILQVAFCDPRLARFLSHLYRRSRQGARVTQPVAV